MYLTLIIFLLSSIIAGLFGRKIGFNSFFITSISILTTIVIFRFLDIDFNNIPVNFVLLRWIDIEFMDVYWIFFFDSLPVPMLIPVLIVSSLVQIYFLGHTNYETHNPRFFGYLNLFILSLLIVYFYMWAFNRCLDFYNLQLYVLELYLLHFLTIYVVSGPQSVYTLAIIKEITEILVFSLKLGSITLIFLVFLCSYSEISYYYYIGILMELTTNNVYNLLSYFIVFLDRIVDIINWPVLDSIWSILKFNWIRLSNDIRELKDLKLFIPVFLLIISYDLFFSYMKYIQKNKRQKYISLDLINKIKHYLPFIHLCLFSIIIIGLYPIFSYLFLGLAFIDVKLVYLMLQGLFELSWWLIELNFDKIIYKTKEKNLWNYIYFSLFQLIFGLCLCIIPNYFVLFIYRLIFGVSNILLINFILKFEILNLKSIFRAILLVSIYILTEWSFFRYILSNIGELLFNFCFILYVIVIEICNIEVLLNKITVFMFKNFVEVYNFINKVKLTKYINNILIMLSYICILVWDYRLKMEGFNPLNFGGAGPSSSIGGSNGDPGGNNSNNLQNAGDQTSTNDHDEGEKIVNNKPEKPETIDPDACFNLLDDSVRDQPNMEKKDWRDFRGYKGNKRTRSPSPTDQIRHSSPFFREISPSPFDKFMSPSHEVRSLSPIQHGRSPSPLDLARSSLQSRIRTTGPNVTLSNTSNSETPLSWPRESLDIGRIVSASGVTLSNTSFNSYPSPIGLRPNISSSSTSNLNTPNLLPIIIPTLASGLISISPNDNTFAPSTISNPDTIRPSDVMNNNSNRNTPLVGPSDTLTDTSNLNTSSVEPVVPNADIPSIILTSNTSDVNTTTPWDNVSHSIDNSSSIINHAPCDPSLKILTHNGNNLDQRQEDSYVGLEGKVRSNMVYDETNRVFIPGPSAEDIQFKHFRIKDGVLRCRTGWVNNTKSYILNLKGKDNLERIPVCEQDDKVTPIELQQMHPWGASVNDPHIYKYSINPHPGQPLKYNPDGYNDVVYNIESALLDMKAKNFSFENTVDNKKRNVILPVECRLFLTEYFFHVSPKLSNKVLPRVNGRVSCVFLGSISVDEGLECIRNHPPKTTRNSGDKV